MYRLYIPLPALRRSPPATRSLRCLEVPIILIAFAFCLTWPGRAGFAGEAAGGTALSAEAKVLSYDADLTLHGVIDATYQRSPQRHVLAARINEADALRAQADSLFAADPAVFALNQNDEIMGADGRQEWEWGVEMPLWLPGQKAARRAVAAQSATAVAASEQALMLTVAGVVRSLVWDLVLGENSVILAGREYEVAQALASDVKRRVELGDLAQTDLILAEQEMLDKDAAYRQLKIQLQQELQSYRIITGLESVPARYTETTPALPQLDANPVLAEARAEIEKAAAMRDQTKRDRASPSLTVGTKHERDGYGEDFADTLGVEFRLPIALRSHAAPALASAEVRLAEARSARDVLLREFETELEQRKLALAATREEIKLAQQRNQLAQKNLELARRAFSLGETDLISLLRIQTQAFAVERTLRRRELELGRHIARLNQVIGVIP